MFTGSSRSRDWRKRKEIKAGFDKTWRIAKESS
jgi:hypothetical protein